MINAKKARKLRKLLGVRSRANRTYITQDGRHHTHPFLAKHHAPIGGTRGGTVTLSRQSERSVYQRIKRRGIYPQVLRTGVVQ